MNKNMKMGVILLAITLMFYGCSSSKMVEYPEPSDAAIDGSFISKAGTFQFGEREYNADYSTITVPENRDNPESRLIHLPVTRIHARTENILEPMFGLAGGP